MENQSKRAYLWANFHDQTNKFIGTLCTSHPTPSTPNTLVLIAFLHLGASSVEPMPCHTMRFENVAKALNTMYANGDFDAITIVYRAKLFKMGELRTQR
jgi:hypothetical protein